MTPKALLRLTCRGKPPPGFVRGLGSWWLLWERHTDRIIDRWRFYEPRNCGHGGVEIGGPRINMTSRYLMDEWKRNRA